MIFIPKFIVLQLSFTTNIEESLCTKNLFTDIIYQMVEYIIPNKRNAILCGKHQKLMQLHIRKKSIQFANYLLVNIILIFRYKIVNVLRKNFLLNNITILLIIKNLQLRFTNTKISHNFIILFVKLQ